MNPDIQRIAEKISSEYIYPTIRDHVLVDLTAALTELSDLRDTQEKELREELKSGRFMDQWGWMQKCSELLAELARRDEVERELRDKLSVAEADVQTILSPFLKKEDELEEENASLRSRIGELEKQLKDLEGESFERDILG